MTLIPAAFIRLLSTVWDFFPKKGLLIREKKYIIVLGMGRRYTYEKQSK